MLAILYTITQFLLASANPLRRDFDTVTIYGPPPGYKPPGTFYGRAMRTGDGSLLATSEIDDTQEPPWFPVYKSDNNGDSWHPLSNVTVCHLTNISSFPDDMLTQLIGPSQRLGYALSAIPLPTGRGHRILKTRNHSLRWQLHSPRSQ